MIYHNKLISPSISEVTRYSRKNILITYQICYESVSCFVRMEMDIDDYTLESVIGKGTFGYIIIWNINVIIHIRICKLILSSTKEICMYTSRIVYLVKRKKDFKLFVIKAQDLSAMTSPSKVYTIVQCWSFIWMKKKSESWSECFRDLESARRGAVFTKIKASEYSILLRRMEEK